MDCGKPLRCDLVSLLACHVAVILHDVSATEPLCHTLSAFQVRLPTEKFDPMNSGPGIYIS